ncbi:MAG: alpha-L-rhamnosidase C-terminal domain-containing protein [Promethearchaeia archaeon]
MWENWNGINNEGVPQDSLFIHVAGIRPLEPVYLKILVKPLPGGSLTSVRCSYQSIAIFFFLIDPKSSFQML